MIVKEVLEEELLTLPEVRDLLARIMEERREEGDEEQVYEFRKAFQHAETFSKLTAAESRELVNKLMELDKMKEVIAVRIADLLPQTRDELRAVYAKEKFTLKEEELDAILDLVLQYI